MMNSVRKYHWVQSAGAAMFVLCLGLFASRSDEATKATGASDAGIRAENQSLSSTLFALAAERYASNEKRGEQWILAVHDWGKNTNTLRYTDGKYQLVSIPVFEDDLPGFRQYVSAYNSFNIRAADVKATVGEYGPAKEVYSLLLRFAAHGRTREELEKRLNCLARLEKGEAGKAALGELTAEYKGLAAFPKLAEVWAVPAVSVTNWGSVRLP